MIKKSLVGILALTLLIGVALAAIFQTTPVQHNVIITGIFKFELFEDSACTILLTDIDWGEVCHNGKPHTLTIYAKNTGNERVWISWSCTDLPSSMALAMQLSGDNWPQGVILELGASGAKRDITMSLTAYPEVPLGPLSFTTTFTGHDLAIG